MYYYVKILILPASLLKSTMRALGISGQKIDNSLSLTFWEQLLKKYKQRTEKEQVKDLISTDTGHTL
jgi:hypothetical protein